MIVRNIMGNEDPIATVNHYFGTKKNKTMKKRKRTESGEPTLKKAKKNQNSHEDTINLLLQQAEMNTERSSLLTELINKTEDHIKLTEARTSNPGETVPVKLKIPVTTGVATQTRTSEQSAAASGENEQIMGTDSEAPTPAAGHQIAEETEQPPVSNMDGAETHPQVLEAQLTSQAERATVQKKQKQDENEDHPLPIVETLQESANPPPVENNQNTANGTASVINDAHIAEAEMVKTLLMNTHHIVPHKDAMTPTDIRTIFFKHMPHLLNKTGRWVDRSKFTIQQLDKVADDLYSKLEEMFGKQRRFPITREKLQDYHDETLVDSGPNSENSEEEITQLVQEEIVEDNPETVSYTHLTLPTICSV